MKTMMTAFAAIVVIAIGAWFGLEQYAGFDAGERQAGDAVRIE